MKVSDAHLDAVRTEGFTVVEGFLEPDLLAEAQAALWDVFPHPDRYFADPEAQRSFASSQFAGIRHFPYPSWALNRLVAHPDLIDAAERLCGVEDVELYKVELWGKYADAIDYDQTLHRDFGNHTLLAPKLADSFVQMTTFLLLSDVTALDGPTKVVPWPLTKDVPLTPLDVSLERFRDHEVAITAPAGSLFIYRTDVLHRGSNFGAPGRSRFTITADYQPRGWPWTGKVAWPNVAMKPAFADAMARLSPRQRRVFGFPAPGDAYWDAQTVRDVGLRYPGMDMSAYGG